MSPITNTKDLIVACNRLKNAPFITVDTEFMRESTYWPKLCLIQAASPDDAFIIDPLADGLDLGPFLDLMRDESLLKVFHACRQDIEIFYNLGAVPKPVFDTQVAAMAAGYGDQVAYDALVRQKLKIEVDKGSRFTDWSRRPLSEQQLLYALGDVTHLAKLFPLLKARLERQNRLEWVMSEMDALSDSQTYYVDPEECWRRLKPRKYSQKYLAVFKEVAAWRERTAQDRDQPRSRILKDEGVDEIATQLPQNAQAFDQLRSVPKGFGASKFGQELSERIRQVLRHPESFAPKLERPASSPQAPASVVELLKVLLKIRCEDEGVAPKLLANVADLEKIALDDEADVAALKGWRREVFGQDALRLKKGRLAVALKNGRISLIEIN